MANTVLSTSSIYSHRLHESEPLKFFIQLMDLKAYEKELAAEPNALEVLSGLVLYRHLPRQEKMQVAGKVYALSNGRLRGKLYGMVGQIAANPYWFCWSLSDKELKDYYQSNKKVSDVLTMLGFDVPSISVASLALGAYSTFKDGLKKQATKGVANVAKSNKLIEAAKDMGLKEKLKGTGGRMLGAFVILLVGFNAMASKSANDAKKELIIRGLIDPSEL